MKEIPLSRGLVALVDDEDMEYLSQFKWSVDGSGYPQRSIKTDKGKSTIRMHRDLLGLGPGEIGDHANGNKLDNRRCNIRRCTQKENNRNRGATRANTSGYKGVHFNKKRGHFQAHITYNYRHIFIGSFSNADDAAAAYDKKARELHGPFACLNFKEG